MNEMFVSLGKIKMQKKKSHDSSKSAAIFFSLDGKNVKENIVYTYCPVIKTCVILVGTEKGDDRWLELVNLLVALRIELIRLRRDRDCG